MRFVAQFFDRDPVEGVLKCYQRMICEYNSLTAGSEADCTALHCRLVCNDLCFFGLPVCVSTFCHH